MTAQPGPPRPLRIVVADDQASVREGLVVLLGLLPDIEVVAAAADLQVSATEHRTRYLAIYELNLEAARRPALRQALAGTAEAALEFTVQQHRNLGLATSRDQVQTLTTLFSGTLLSLAAGPPEEVTPHITRTLARAMVTGAISATESR